MSFLENPLLAYWVHDLEPVIYQFTEIIAIRWYGLAYVAAFLIGFALLRLYWKRGLSILDPRMQESLGIGLIMGVILGGRIGYFIFYEPGTLLSNPMALFQVWNGGMASHGGFIGVAVAVLWMARRLRVNPLYISDLIVSVAAEGFLLGRIANFIRGELWGKITDVPWAVIFPDSATPGLPVAYIPPRHPSQLYEAALEGLALFLFMQWRFWKVKGRGPHDTVSMPLSARSGHLTGEFFIFYSLSRAVSEIFREPDASLILGMSRGTFYSIFLLVAGISLILWSRSRKLTNG